MKWQTLYIVVLMSCGCGRLGAQLQVLPDKEDSPCVLGGVERNITVMFRNPGSERVETQLGIRLYQASSATAAPFSKAIEWKKIQVLPGQTVLESATVNFPSVKAETKFIVQWQAAANRVLGTTEIRVYPADLLLPLKTLAGEGGPGVFDPQNQLKPLLKNLNINFVDLQTTGLGHFSGRLAIIGPFQSPAQLPEGLPGQIRKLAGKGVGVVWIQPPLEKKDKPVPSFYSLEENTNAVVIVQAEMVAGLSENPQGQKNLVYFCQLALQPESLSLPRFALQP